MVAISLVVPSSLSARQSICPPPARSAPGSSSFPACVVPPFLRILRLVAVALVFARFVFRTLALWFALFPPMHPWLGPVLPFLLVSPFLRVIVCVPQVSVDVRRLVLLLWVA